MRKSRMLPPTHSTSPQAPTEAADTTTAPPPVGDAFGGQLLQLTGQLRAFLSRLQSGGKAFHSSLDDLAQETLARAWRSRASYEERRGTLIAWLLRIAFTVYLDHRAVPPPTSAAVT